MVHNFFCPFPPFEIPADNHRRAFPHGKFLALCERIKGAPKGHEVIVHYVYVGSHNLTRAALGYVSVPGTELLLNNFELGTLFTPRLDKEWLGHKHFGFSIDERKAAEEANKNNVEVKGPEDLLQFMPKTVPEEVHKFGFAEGARPTPEKVVFRPLGDGTAADDTEPSKDSVRLPFPFEVPPNRLYNGEDPMSGND